MKRPAAIAGSALFFIVVPSVVAGVLPWLILDGYSHPLASIPALLVGGLLVVAGLVFLLHSFSRFALDGLGTPAPVAPTEKLVVTGVYRHVRNPMYLSVLSIIAGQALIFASWPVLIYGLVIAAMVTSFVRLYEEPTLARDFGEAYDIYRRNVPGWLPRLTPWRGS